MKQSISPLLQMGMMAQQYLKGRLLRTILTTLAIVFGVALVFALNLSLPNVFKAFDESLNVGGERADLTISSRNKEAFVPRDTVQTIADVDGIDAVTSTLRRRVTLPDNADSAFHKAPYFDLIGVDVDTVRGVHRYELAQGQFVEVGETGTAIISTSINGNVGDTISFPTALGEKTYTIVGILKQSTDIPLVIISLEEAQTALNLTGMVNIIEANLAQGANEERVTSNVENVLGENFSLSEGGASALFLGEEFSIVLSNTLGSVALFLGAFLIFNTFRTVIIERRRDLAMLRAIGATRRQITQLILVESLLQGIVGTLIGLVLGYVLALLITASMNDLLAEFMSVGELEISITPGVLLLSVTMGLGTTFLAGYLPARNAGKISPIEALRPTKTADIAHAARWGLYTGGILMLLAVGLLVGSSQTAPLGAVVFLLGLMVASPGMVVPMARLFQPFLTLWFAREGNLAQHNILRQPGRAAITASTLMIGLAALILAAAMVSSMTGFVSEMVDSNFSSDVLILPPQLGEYSGVVGADEQLANRLRELPEVEVVSTLRYASSTQDGQHIGVLGLDGDTYPQTSPMVFAEGKDDAAYAALSEGRNAIMNSVTATSLDLKVGSDFILQTSTGPQTYTVVGIANDSLTFKLTTVFISQANLAQDFHRTDDVMLMLNLKSSADQKAVMAEIKSIAEDYPQFTVASTADYREEFMKTATVGMQMYYALGLFILIPAALGLLNTLTINVLERTREIGIVRAIGGSRRQIRRMITAEALLLGLFGATTGVLAGVAMSYGITMAFSSIGFQVAYTLPLLGIGATVVLAVLLALFSSILPARNAAQLDIVRVLQYE